ncbi:bifunctional diguanylate cyclase/phosphodiesterase [Amphritea sp. HPY]|uniref:bifunctional diguanylate cyclase/phosphodiesterase n=1 Tax=Amphritea sp. HPY TaxID=3421652 RepID=UPI003D7D672C
MKLRTKLPLVVVPLIAGPLLLVGLLAYIELKNSSENTGRQQVDTLIEQFDNQLQQTIASAKANVSIFSDDLLLKNYLLTEDAEERYGLLQRPLQKKLLTIQRVYPEYYEIRVLLPDGYEDLRLVNRDLPNLIEEEASSPTFQAMRSVEQDTLAQVGINPDNGALALYVSCQIRLVNIAVDSFRAAPKLRGYLSLTISLQRLIDALSPSPWPQGGIILTDTSGAILAASKELDTPQLLADYDLAQNIIQQADMSLPLLNNQQYHHHSRRLQEGLWVHMLFPQSELLKDSRDISQLVLIVCLAAITCSIPLLLFLLRRQFLKPVENLNQALASLGEQQQLVQVAVQSDDEIGELSHSFNNMSLALNESNEKIRNLAFSDSLTGLPNRLMFAKNLRREIETARRSKGSLALLFIDLDNFKHINDTQGHQAGDQLLVKVADIIQANLRGYDSLSRVVGGDELLSVARLGGDEFTLLLQHLDTELMAGQVADRLIRAISEPIDVLGKPCYIGCSIGIATYPNDGNTGEDLIKHADMAMYQAKMRGKGNYQFFSNTIATLSEQRVFLDQRLHQAVDELNFELHYQPIIDSKTQEIVSVEALIRWNDAQLGAVPPDQFIPLAEENGLILAIGAWVMEEAAQQQSVWKKSNLPCLKIAINVSSIQLNQPDFAQQMADLLIKYKLSKDDLYVELTETALLQGEGLALDNLHKMHQLGISIALDDFGTGYSSLSYLQNLPIDILKIDRSFIMNLQEHNNGVILSAIITMAHALGMKVVAEGVEDHQHLAFLDTEGCDLLQGYLFSRPCPAREIEQLLEKSPLLPALA